MGDSTPCAPGYGNTDTVETNVKQLGVVHHGLSTRTSHKIGETKKSRVIVSDTNRHLPTNKTVPKTKIKAIHIRHTTIKGPNQEPTSNKPSHTKEKKRNLNPTQQPTIGQRAKTKNKGYRQAKRFPLRPSPNVISAARSRSLVLNVMNPKCQILAAQATIGYLPR